MTGLPAALYDPRESIAVGEAARRVGRSVRTIRDWCMFHKIGRRIAGRWLVNQIALDMLVENDSEALTAFLAGDRSSPNVLAYYQRRNLPAPSVP